MCAYYCVRCSLFTSLRKLIQTQIFLSSVLLPFACAHICLNNQNTQIPIACAIFINSFLSCNAFSFLLLLLLLLVFRLCAMCELFVWGESVSFSLTYDTQIGDTTTANLLQSRDLCMVRQKVRIDTHITHFNIICSIGILFLCALPHFLTVTHTHIFQLILHFLWFPFLLSFLQKWFEGKKQGVEYEEINRRCSVNYVVCECGNTKAWIDFKELFLAGTDLVWEFAILRKDFFFTNLFDISGPVSMFDLSTFFYGLDDFQYFEKHCTYSKFLILSIFVVLII